MCVITDGTEKPIPQGAKIISDNSIAIVWRDGNGTLYKRSMPFLIENELHCLKAMWPSGFVPSVYRYDKYTLAIQDLGDSEPVTDKGVFITNMYALQMALKQADIRHGDMTTAAVIVKDNHPYLIDFAESRLISDPRPDKRPQGDGYWMRQTINELTKGL